MPRESGAPSSALKMSRSVWLRSWVCGGLFEKSFAAALPGPRDRESCAAASKTSRTRFRTWW